MYERLWVYFNSASRAHLEWLGARVEARLGIRGYLSNQVQNGKRDFFRLKYGKHGSIALLRAMYPDDEVPRLLRKWKIWNGYERRNLNCAEGGI